MTAMPTQKTVKIPLTFEAHVHAMKKPVARSHVHHSNVNSLLRPVSSLADKSTFQNDAHITVLAEADVRVDGQGHEEDQSRVQEDKS